MQFAEIHRHGKRAAAFTLIEVLVVVAIIALLVAILLPSLARARANTRTVVCTTQIQQLMRAALLYKTDFKDRLPGTGINDASFKGEYDSGARTDWLTWSGVWHVMLTRNELATSKAWANAPRGGRLWKYYKDEKLLLCPAAENPNGKFSYSVPEAVSWANPGQDGRLGLTPIMDQVKHPASAILFLDEDEANGINAYSIDDGFGQEDLFADRHLGKATVAFFDGHANAYYFGRGDGKRRPDWKVRYTQNLSESAFIARFIQIAPFNCRYTPEPWKIRSQAQLPKFKASNAYPGCSAVVPPGCE
jgi:prepilin-type N-terminal cleavage/methylation domain-containing protein/prepilin-type processing-associated H-X9-DG protein